MGSRLLSKTKGRLFFLFVMVLMVVSAVYLYLMYIQENFKNAKWSEKRCLSELTSIKYQLNVVTEYKNRIEKMLSELQKTHDADKEKFKDVAESCVTMKQQSLICQSQFDDLQSECKKVREVYNQEKSDALKLQENVINAQQARDSLQNTVYQLNSEINSLREDHAVLQSRLQQQMNEESPQASGMRHYNDNNFSNLQEESDGVYKVNIKTSSSNVNQDATHLLKDLKLLRSDKSIVNKALVNANIVENQLDKLKADDMLNVQQGDPISHDVVPPGFAPVLPIFDNAENPNLAKPVHLVNRANVDEKRYNNGDNMPRDPENNRKLKDVDQIAEPRGDFDEALRIDNLHLDPDNKVINPNDVQIPVKHLNPGAQEDDDEGEEYGT